MADDCIFYKRQKCEMNPDAAQNIAIAGLQFIASDESRLSRFVALTGLVPDDIRHMAQSKEFLLAVIEFFLSDETLLTEYAAAQNIDPSSLAGAKLALDPGSAFEH